VGIGLRLIEYLYHDSLWGDEAMLALNIASHSFRELLQPLAYAQVGPVPFLWAERLMVVLFGVNEWALRALPLLAGSALCIVVARTSRSLLRPQEALAALVMTAFSQPLIRYSVEVKPYGLDALVALVMVLAAATLIRQVNQERSWWLLGGVGLLAILVSVPSVFVCAGIIVALVFHALRVRRPYLLPRLAVLALGWGVLFTVLYLKVYRETGRVPYMRSFWEGAFLIPGSPGLLPRGVRAAQEVLWPVNPGAALVGLQGLTAGLILIGVASLWRRGQIEHVLLLSIPVLAAVAASGIGAYPIATRLTLFAAPLLIILAAVGIVTVGALVHHLAARIPARWIATVLLLPTVTSALAWPILHQRDQQMRPLVEDLTGRWRPGDAVYVYHRVIPAWLYYSTDWAAPDPKLSWAMAVSGPGGLAHENGPSRGPRSLGEGSELVYDLGQRTVLLGTSSGVQGRPMFGYRPERPDPGWAESESNRICLQAHPRAWIVSGNAYRDEVKLTSILLKVVGRAGGKLIYQHSTDQTALYLLEFPAGRACRP
jgi:hypothetical protein